MALGPNRAPAKVSVNSHHLNNMRVISWSERDSIIKRRADDCNIIFFLRVGETFDVV